MWFLRAALPVPAAFALAAIGAGAYATFRLDRTFPAAAIDPNDPPSLEVNARRRRG